MRQAREGMLDLLEVQLPFMVKVVLHYEISEESLEGQAIFSERRMATVPFLARPLANPDQRLGRVISVVRQEFEQHLEHARWSNSLQTFEGFITIQIYSTPSRELAQLPAASGRNFDGGCWKELPEILRQGNKGPVVAKERGPQLLPLLRHCRCRRGRWQHDTCGEEENGIVHRLSLLPQPFRMLGWTPSEERR